MTNKYIKSWDRWAKLWDPLLSMVGFDAMLRKQAVEKLELTQGDIVLDLACGTGLNFKYLERKIGKEGEIIALDYSSEMLKKAEGKIYKYGWQNINLFKKDVSNLKLNEKVDAILCTWAMVTIQNYEKTLKNSIDFLKEGGKYVILDFQLITGFKGLFLNPVYKLLFKVTHQDVTRKTWNKMRKYLKNVTKEEFSGLLASYYIATGTK